MDNHAPIGGNSNVVDFTTARQHKASDPQASAWVSANAGSGKTFVLAQRVVRLLLSGVAPSKILCITFTKAAAAEMANRVFLQLSSWSLLGDDELRDALHGVGEIQSSKQKLRKARRLFTRALETPGGLKIQTIHAFCESLLQRFTLEANISGHFEVLGDFDRNLMLRQARESVFAYPRDPNAFSSALSAAMGYGSDSAIDDALKQIIEGRQGFRNWILSHGDVATAIGSMAEELHIDIDTSEAEFCWGLLEKFPISDARLNEIGIAAGEIKGANSQKLHAALQRYHNMDDSVEKLALRLSILLTEKGTIRKNVGVDALYKLVPGSKEEFTAEGEFVLDILEEYKQRRMLLGSAGLFEIADEVLEEYQRRKQRASMLDYDDLINQSADLLSRHDVRAWVQYKLDQGIDHVLVDEAQDTSPTQWQIIDGIVDDFFSGQSASVQNRTVFAVGDQKQSIFSFQGALPEMFNRQKRAIEKRTGEVGQPFNNIVLPVSFRSTRDVLKAVDLVFEDPAMRQGLQEDGEAPVHEAARQSDPGEVVIWPMEMPGEKITKDEWWQPLDAQGEESPPVRLAKRITGKIKSWIDADEILEGQGREIRYGDILILVRHRKHIANTITRELKDAGLNVAGADRLTLGEHVAIEDLLSLAKWALFCDDDLALAELFKSPLLGLSEDQLFEVAHGRGDISLWDSMCNPEASWDAQIADAIGYLNHCLESAGNSAPFEFYSEILGRFGGRRKFKARLGDEVDDVLDAFLNEALSHALSGGKGLQDFVHSMESISHEIKREVDLQRNEIRVMTAHSAKGLEAPIVFLVDPGKEISSAKFLPKIVKLKSDRQTTYLWQPDKNVATQLSEEFFINYIQHEEDEYRRLLYVGMTRAADRLIVCGYGSTRSEKYHTWLPMVQHALTPSAQEVLHDGEVVEWIWKSDHKNRKAKPLEEQSVELDANINTLPEWASVLPKIENLYRPPIAPSLAGASVHAENNIQSSGPTIGEHHSIERGSAIHRLLQSLPEVSVDLRKSIGMTYLDNHFAKWSDVQRENVLTEVLDVMSAPGTQALFGADSQAEVGISGTLMIRGISREISGQIDRLVIGDAEIILVDYKSDRNTPDTPEGVARQYLVQVAIYAELLGKIYPGKPIKSALLWTNKPLYMEIPTDLLATCLNEYIN